MEIMIPTGRSYFVTTTSLADNNKTIGNVFIDTTPRKYKNKRSLRFTCLMSEPDSQRRNVATPKELGECIAAVRVASGLRQADAAALCGVSEPFLNRLEGGKATARLDAVLKVCAGLGIALELVLPTTLPANPPTSLKRGPKKAA
jgi:DNA-binding XRE family transcriptional regulator